MKILISHDVDHLFRNDHYKDLIYPKLWVRSTMEVLKKHYGLREWGHRMLSPFQKRRHRIEEVMMFDRAHGISSTFFFGMSKGLGMSYSLEKAKPVINKVIDEGFDVGVHGIEYKALDGMKKEYMQFSKLTNQQNFGMRMHYVRFDEDTFENLDRCGYLFDTTEFDKKKGYLIKAPYKVGGMWEFPLTIMDGYLPHKLEEKKQKSIEIIEMAEKVNMEYISILFHDALFCKGYKTYMEWYKWIVQYLKDRGDEFISYREAIQRLEKSK